MVRSYKIKHRMPAIYAGFVVIYLFLTTTSILADSHINGTITIKYKLTGVTFSVYRVADVDGTLAGAFADCEVDVADTTAAARLADYVTENKLEPSAKGTTAKADEDDGSSYGEVVLPAADDDITLDTGVYLVMGDTATYDGYRYIPSNALVMIAQTKADTATDAHLSALLDARVNTETVVKYRMQSTYVPPSDKDPDDTEQIDTEPVDTVRDPVEEEPGIVDIDGGGGDDVDKVKEKNPGDEDVDPVGDGTGNPDDETDLPDDGVTPVGTPQPQDIAGDHLPQTGQLWWPVAPLSAGGVCFLTIGIRRRRNTETRYSTT